MYVWFAKIDWHSNTIQLRQQCCVCVIVLEKASINSRVAYSCSSNHPMLFDKATIYWVNNRVIPLKDLRFLRFVEKDLFRKMDIVVNSQKTIKMSKCRKSENSFFLQTRFSIDLRSLWMKEEKLISYWRYILLIKFFFNLILSQRLFAIICSGVYLIENSGRIQIYLNRFLGQLRII